MKLPTCLHLQARNSKVASSINDLGDASVFVPVRMDICMINSYLILFFYLIILDVIIFKVCNIKQKKNLHLDKKIFQLSWSLIIVKALEIRE